MRSLAIWWLAISSLGWVTWPLLASVFRRVPGRGYAYARAFGLLLLSYTFWLLGMLGVLANNTVAVWCVAGVLAFVGAISWVRRRVELVEFVRQEWRYILTAELLFALVCVLYALHKSYDPAIDHTEEPMDFAFLNGILRSPRMPPNDPWLSGFSISYYYFGYLTVAMLVRLTGLPSGVGYNLGLAHTLALTVVGGYGLIYDLVRMGGGAARPQRGFRRASLFGIVGGVAIGIAGNLEGILELLGARGLGPDALYRWIGVQGLSRASPGDSWLPVGHWWWWRASRVIKDLNILGKNPTVITEFPAFSFVLGDLHPHVMALPYVLMALGLASQLYAVGRAGLTADAWRRPRYWALPLIFGALGFLNSWDLPTYLVVGILAFCVGRWQGAPGWRAWVKECAIFSLCLVLLSVALYIPFYLRLHSQAEGIGVAYYAKTPLKQYLLIFGLWLLPILADDLPSFLERMHPVGETTRSGPGIRGRLFLAAWLVVFLVPWGVTALLGGWGRMLLGLIPLVTTGPWLLLLQSGILAMLLLDLWAILQNTESGQSAGRLLSRILVLVGIGLTYVTEFIYLRDLFDTRMNTVFKVYYQAWVLLGTGAALAAYRLWREGGWRRTVSCFSGLLLCACLYYPIAAVYTKAGGYRGQATLDGTFFLRGESPDEYGAYLWLNAHAQPGDVLAEASGEEYDASTSRLSAWTGVPTILGWAGHEVQWRGDDEQVLARLSDVEKIYSSPHREDVLAVLHEYGVTYLYVGRYEGRKYSVDAQRLDWYDSFLETCYAEGDIRLYQIPSR